MRANKRKNVDNPSGARVICILGLNEAAAQSSRTHLAESIRSTGLLVGPAPAIF